MRHSVMMFQMVVGKEANLGSSVNGWPWRVRMWIPHALAISFQDLPYLTSCSLQDATPKNMSTSIPLPNSLNSVEHVFSTFGRLVILEPLVTSCRPTSENTTSSQVRLFNFPNLSLTLLRLFSHNFEFVPL